MDKYSAFANKHSLYLILDYGEQKQVQWVKDGVEGVNKFGSPCMVFEFDDGGGPKKYTISTSGVIRQFSNFQIGDTLNIKRNEKGVKPALAVWKEGTQAPF